VPATYSEDNKGLNHEVKRLIVSKSTKRNYSKCHANFTTSSPRNPNLIQNASLLMNFTSGVLNSQSHYKLRNSHVICKTPNACSWLVFNFVKNFFFCHENAIFALAAKIALIRNARNHEDAAQRLQRFAHWEVFFEETFHRRFAMLALNVHGLHHRSKSYRSSPGW
jgi:hypothetical protein